MSSSLHNMFTPRRRRGKTWDADTHSGALWMWAGKFSRWKRREVTAQQPGLLKYCGRERRGKAKTGSINLHGASVELSAGDARLIILRGPDIGKVYLRTTDPDDRQICVESIQKSIHSFGTLLSRASAVFGVPQQDGELITSLKPKTSAKAAKLAEEPQVARKLHEQVKSRMKSLEAFRDAFEHQLTGLQNQLQGIATALRLTPTSNNAAEANGLAQQQSAEEELLRRESARGLTRADSFESALSELQRSPSWQDGILSEGAGPFKGTSMHQTWQAFNEAVEACIRSDAVRIIELQAENEALKTAMRNFKNRAVAMRATQSQGESLSRVSLERLPSSGSEEIDTSTPQREQSADFNRSPSRDYADVEVTGMSSASTEEYKKALEALEAIQRHAFEVSSQRHRDADTAVADEPPPETDAELEEMASDDESRNESRRAISLQLDNPWEVAARRERLPAPAPLQRGFSIWSVLKNALGKDLTRITLPATINEPLSALQRIVEDLEYRHLLDEAMASQDPSQRMLLVAAFVASGYSATLQRESKPFNPLLGETFEWQAADSSCRFVCEQVSHHPPISCWWSDSTSGWQYWGEMELRSKFWGKSVEMMPTGTCWLQLGDELWSWNKPNMSINNIILGTIWLEWHGKITITNHTTGVSETLIFPKSNGHLDARGVVQCLVRDSHGSPALKLAGKYTERLVAVPAKTQNGAEEDVFRVNAPPEQGSLQYNLTRMAMTLNTAEPELLRQLPPTDSRLRPDQRALEDGDLERATPEKMRLEDKQRESRRIRKERGEPFFPVWFRLQHMTEKQQEGADQWLGTPLVRLPGQAPPCLWQFTGEYWDAKQKQDWRSCPDIYSATSEIPSPVSMRRA